MVVLQLQDNRDNKGNNTQLEVVLDIEVDIVGKGIEEVVLLGEVVELVDAWVGLQLEPLLEFDREFEREEEDFGMEAVDIGRMWGRRQFRER